MAACELRNLSESTNRAADIALQLVDVGAERSLINATRRLAQRQQCRWLRDMF